MILGRETINQLAEHPPEPKVGYIHIYGYGNSIWMMRSNGEKYDLLNPGSGGGGNVPYIRQGVTSLTAGEWLRILFADYDQDAMPTSDYTVAPLVGLMTNGDQVPMKVKNFSTLGFDVWVARSCTFRWNAIKV